MHVLRFGNKLKVKVCRGFIFANLFNSLYLLVRLWWNVLVTNLATNFQDLVAKVKKLGACIRRNFTPWNGQTSDQVIAVPLEYYWQEILTIKGEDIFSKASSILFAVWLVTPLLPDAIKWDQKKRTPIKCRFSWMFSTSNSTKKVKITSEYKSNLLETGLGVITFLTGFGA